MIMLIKVMNVEESDPRSFGAGTTKAENRNTAKYIKNTKQRVLLNNLLQNKILISLAR